MSKPKVAPGKSNGKASCLFWNGHEALPFVDELQMRLSLDWVQTAMVAVHEDDAMLTHAAQLLAALSTAFEIAKGNKSRRAEIARALNRCAKKLSAALGLGPVHALLSEPGYRTPIVKLVQREIADCLASGERDPKSIAESCLVEMRPWPVLHEYFPCLRDIALWAKAEPKWVVAISKLRIPAQLTFDEAAKFAERIMTECARAEGVKKPSALFNFEQKDERKRARRRTQASG